MSQHQQVAGIKIYNQVQMIALSKININNWNPNFESSEIQNAVKDDIIKNGFIDPITVQKKNKKMNKQFVIIDGEHRFLKLKEIIEQSETKKPIDKQDKKLLDKAMIPCIVIDCSDKTAMALTIRLNRERGSLMPDKLGQVIREISPNADVDYLHDLVYIPRDELLLLSGLSENKNDFRDTNNGEFELETPESYLDPDKQNNKDSNEIGQSTNQTQCPKCHFRFMLPVSSSSK